MASPGEPTAAGAPARAAGDGHGSRSRRLGAVIARKAAVLWTQDGPRAALAWVTTQLVRPQRFVVLARDLTAPWPADTPPPGIVVHVGAADRLRPASGAGLPGEFFFDRIYGFSTGVFSFVRGELARVDWLALPGEFNRYLDLRPDEAEAFQTYALPRYRAPVVARALGRAAIFARFAWLRSRGYGLELARVGADRAPLQRVLEAYGYRPVGTVRQVALYAARFRTAR
jgi:hypothetical protein